MRPRSLLWRVWLENVQLRVWSICLGLISCYKRCYLAAFREAWFREASFTGPVCFCGGLDWSGLAIFRSLKAVFPDLAPWKPGYERMLRAAEQGCCHTLEMAEMSFCQPASSKSMARKWHV